MQKIIKKSAFFRFLPLFSLLLRKNRTYMEDYTANTERTARAYNLTPQTVVFCYAVAAGAPTADAYRATHTTKTHTTAEQCEQMAADLLSNNQGAKILIQRIKQNKNRQQHNPEPQPDNQTQQDKERKRDELRTRGGIIDSLITEVSGVHGKEAIGGLQTLAKLQGYDKPDEAEQDERRRYFLPWVSRCRNCALMKLYRDTSAEK